MFDINFDNNKKPNKKNPVKKTETKKKIEPAKRKTITAEIKTKVLDKQQNKCAGKNCADLHNGKKVPVNSTNNFDHKTPVALGGKTIVSNIQALCPNCHHRKTQEDRAKIARAKKQGKISTEKKSTNKKNSYDSIKDYNVRNETKKISNNKERGIFDL